MIEAVLITITHLYLKVATLFMSVTMSCQSLLKAIVITKESY